jgi:hypothetical protein
MITVRMAEMVMVATVRYPVPGGASQLASLKLITTTYSTIVWMAPKAVASHSTTTRRRTRRPRTSGCHAKIAARTFAAAVVKLAQIRRDRKL